MKNDLGKHIDIKEGRRVLGEISESQLNILQEISKFQKKAESPRSKIEQSIDQQRESYRKKLEDVRTRKELHQSSKEKVSIKKSEQSLEIGDGYTYNKTTKSYLEITTGTPTTEITIRVEKDDSAPVERTIQYSGEASAIARLCSSKMDAFIQNNYHDALAQAKLKIEEEMAPRYAELGTTPDPAARESLERERQQKIAEVEEKAGAALRKFFDKYGGRHMNAELLEELEWVEGIDAAARDIKSRITGAENKLKSNPEELQRITADIDNKIQEIERLLSSSSATPSESHALAGSSNPSSSEASHLSQDTLTLENFATKIKAYRDNPTGRGLSDNIYKEIASLATDESTYKNMTPEDQLKIRKALLDIGLKLVERQYKMDEPFEMLEKWERYSASHYGKRLMYERQLVDHLETVAKAAGEHAVALDKEKELILEVDRYYKAAGKASLHPTSSGPHAAEFSAQLESTVAKFCAASDKTEQEQHRTDLVHLIRQVRDTLQPNSLQISLENLEKAHLDALAKLQHYEQTKASTDKLQKLIELEKERDDVNDGIEISKVRAIKETDKTTLQHLREWEHDMVKHFYTYRHEDHKALNKEEEEIRQFLIQLEKIDIGYQIQHKRMAKMYWLALFGSGDQAALFSLGRESTSEFNAFMSLFR